MAKRWKSPKSAPRDGTLVLLNIGYPWAVSGVWDDYDGQWAYASLQCCPMKDGKMNSYLECEYANDDELRGWMPLPTF